MVKPPILSKIRDFANGNVRIAKANRKFLHQGHYGYNFITIGVLEITLIGTTNGFLKRFPNRKLRIPVETFKEIRHNDEHFVGVYELEDCVFVVNKW